ncbi:MAG: hypothetical protein KBH45_19805 [Verrucomicrobia bacterium]|nr:hypothetical protein [Verrucomicrobiota bacterium]
MQPEPEIPPLEVNPQTGSVPPLLSGIQPPAHGDSPALLQAKPHPKALPVERMLAILLSLCLGLFLADAAVALADDSLILGLEIHLLTMIRGLLFFVSLLMTLLLYGLMGLIPAVPKRLFLPVALFNPVAGLVLIPIAIYSFGQLQRAAWGISFCEAILGLSILCRAQHGFRLRWPLVAEDQLGMQHFSWRHLSRFLLVNLVLVLPAVVVYLGVCAILAVDHFSDGFLALRRDGLTVQVRKYIRNDGKTIQLVPMSHIGESDFYQQLAQSFPTNAIVLMEGVSDDQNLLTNKMTYQRMADTLGVAEQQEEFQPRGEIVSADVDVAEFSPNTIGFLNLVMLLHSQGMKAETVLQVMQFSPPHFEVQLFDDLLRKRNRRVLEEIRTRLSVSDSLIIPWGAAHMPEIAREIQKSGFRLQETQDYVAIRFGPAGIKKQTSGKEADSSQPK